MFQFINLTIDDRVGRIAFARPPLNVFHIPMMKEINQALERVLSERELVAVLFESAPGTQAFSAGVAVEDHGPDTVYQMLEEFHQIFRSLEEARKPAISIVDGPAFGGGCELVAGCDLVLATDRSRFGQPEIKLGVFPPIASVLLPRIVGDKRAREMVLTGEIVGAKEAAAMGLINHVCTVAELPAKTEEMLNRFRELSSSALEFARHAMDIARNQPFMGALLKVEDLYLNDLMRTQDAQEGIRAFVEKRKPAWKHR
jgi:cyclohexa-1,5-dienecarbonyl-CoA hydratase